MGPAAIGDSRKAPVGLSRSRQDSTRSQKGPNSLPQVAADSLTSSHARVQKGCCARIRVQVSAGSDLLREALCRGLSKVERIAVFGSCSERATHGAEVSDSVDVLILISRERLQPDLDAIHRIRESTRDLKILFLGTASEDGEFLQYVRAGINGFLSRDASTDDIVQAIENVHDGKAVCPGELCAALFRFFEDAEPRLPFASPTERLGFTRREQQIVPLIAKGLTNKEIASHFCLSEQTVKNHLYRMKHKIGAEDRLSIVQKFRHHGLLL